MNTLAVDTSLVNTAVAAQVAEKAPVSESFIHQRDALRRLTGLMQDVINRAGIHAQEIGLVVTSRGPGSFTGLRIGMAAAKAFADAAGAKIVGVSTLRMLAIEASKETSGLIVPIIESCPGEVYVGCFSVDSRSVETIEPECVITTDRLSEWISGLQEPAVTVIGPAVAKYSDSLPPGVKTILKDGFDVVNLLQEGIRQFNATGGEDPLELVPEYLRASQAEIRAAETPSC